MERHIKWFDLARFGAALRVVPDSPLRTELVPPDDSTLGELQSAFGLLENLERFTLGGWQSNSAMAPVAAEAAEGSAGRKKTRLNLDA